MYIRRVPILMLAIVLAAFLLSSLAVNVASAQSQSNPFCFSGPPPREVDCNENSWKSLVQNSTGGPPQQGKCYGFGFGVVTYDYNAAECVKSRTDVTTQAAAVCVNFSGNRNDYWSGNFERSALSSTECNDSFSAGQAYTPGTTYVKDSQGELSVKPSNEHDLIVSQSRVRGEESAAAGASSGSNFKVSNNTGREDIGCGGGPGFEKVKIAFNIGCRGKGNPIIDMLFAAIRVITTGVGFALIASIIIAGVQYTTASGDPNKTSLAKKRLVSTLLVALPLYLLTYAILNWIVPGAIFK
jgi:hypothetical protein